MSRTIFLFIRGIDQSGRAFSKATKELTNIQRLQRDLARSSYRLLFAGAAFSLFAVKATQGILSIMQRTSQGALVVDDFNRSWGRLMDALSERFTIRATPWIDTLIKQLDKLAGMPRALDFIVSVGMLLTGVAIAGAVIAGALSFATGIGSLVVGLLGKAGLGWLIGKGATSALTQTTLTSFVGGASSYAWILPALEVAVPILLTFIITWGLAKLFQQSDVDKALEDIQGNTLLDQTLAPWLVEKMRGDTGGGIGGIDDLTGGDAGGLTTGGVEIEVNVDIHDNDLSGADSDTVGGSVGNSVAEQLKDYIDVIRR